MAMFAAPVMAGCPCQSGNQVQQEATTGAVLAASENTTPALVAAREGSDLANAAEMARNMTREMIASINVTGIGQNLTRSQERIMSNVMATHMVNNIRERVAPALLTVRNRLALVLNNTEKVRIGRDVRARIRPVTEEMEHIRINGTALIIHNVTNPAVQVQMTIRRENGTVTRNMTITRTRDQRRLNISVGGTSVTTESEVVYENGTLYINHNNRTIELRNGPEEIRRRLRERLEHAREIIDMRLEVAENRLRYAVKTKTTKKILGLFDAEVEEESDVDADTGEVTSTRGPWWGFLAW